MKQLQNVLLVSGSGQNTGKTTFACRIIQLLQPLSAIAVKISPHLHKASYPLPQICSGDGFVIYQETNSGENKDSSRFLKAGAAVVYLVMAEEKSLALAAENLIPLLDPGIPVVCESGGIAAHIDPGLHCYLGSSTTKGKKAPPANALRVRFNGFRFDPHISSFQFVNGKWYFSQT